MNVRVLSGGRRCVCRAVGCVEAAAPGLGRVGLLVEISSTSRFSGAARSPHAARLPSRTESPPWTRRAPMART